MRWMWIDRVVELVPKQRLVAVKSVSLAEEHVHDHFEPDDRFGPATPVMPGSLILEGCAQTAGILVGHAEGFAQKVILAKVARAELTADATPGCTLRYSATLEQIGPAGATTRTAIDLLDHARPAEGFRPAGEVEMMFSHIDQNMAGTGFPEHNFVFTEQFRTLLRSSGIDAGF